MPIFAVHAYENQYGGLHGMEEHFVVECEELSYARDLAEESSRHVMESYDCIGDSLTSTAEGYIDYGDDEEEAEHEHDEGFDEAFEQAVAENVAYDIYLLKNPNKLPLAELERLASEDFDELLRVAEGVPTDED